MGRIEKTVFISYRRSTGSVWALAIARELTHHGYDVFFDFTGMASGDFERSIVENIKARAHFLILLTPSALERVDEPGDWLRREIETAIEHRRNIVPIMLEGFDFATPWMQFFTRRRSRPQWQRQNNDPLQKPAQPLPRRN